MAKKSKGQEASQQAVLSPLERALVKLHEEQTFRERDGFSISQLGNCAAQQLFAISGLARGNQPTARQLLTWRAGNIIEAEIYYLLEQLAGEVVVGKQKEFIGANPPREGHIDGLILKGDKLYVFDAKSANGRSFDEWLNAAGLSKWDVLLRGFGRFDPREIPEKQYRPVRTLYESYYFQAQGYLELVNSRPEYQVYRIDNMVDPPLALTAVAENGAVPIATDGFYFYVYCKDDSRLYEEFVPYDPDAIKQRLKLLDKAYRQMLKVKGDETELVQVITRYREIQKTDKGKLHWKCRRCSFVQLCWD